LSDNIIFYLLIWFMPCKTTDQDPGLSACHIDELFAIFWGSRYL